MAVNRFGTKTRPLPARDRLGEKSLHFYWENGDFVFASEIKSILAFPAVQPRLNLEALNRYLSFEYVPAPLPIAFRPLALLLTIPLLTNRAMPKRSSGISVIPAFLLSKHARKQVTVALSGDGGDELFAGYPTYQAHQIVRWIPGWLGKPLTGLAGLLPVSHDNISFDFKVRRFAAGISYPQPVRNQIWLGAFEPNQKKLLFTEEAWDTLKQSDEFDLVKEYWDLCDSSEALNRIASVDMRFYLQDDILCKVDRMSMANSLEVRAPYLDHELVEFVCRLKPELKLKGLTTKYILKKAAQGMLPNRIIHRKKKGFGVPLSKWIKKDLRDLFEDTFNEHDIRENGLFNATYIRQLLNEHIRGRKDHRKLLWTLFSL